MTLLATARLQGTPLGADAGPLLHDLLTDPRVAATLGGVPSQDALAGIVARHAAHWIAHGFGYWLWRDRATGAVVARGGLQLVVVGGRAEVEVGWAVASERWGEGLASELGEAAVAHAFGPLGLTEVVAFTLPTNHTSRRVMEKLGFSRESAHVQHAGLDHVLYRQRAGRPPPGELA